MKISNLSILLLGIGLSTTPLINAQNNAFHRLLGNGAVAGDVNCVADQNGSFLVTYNPYSQPSRMVVLDQGGGISHHMAMHDPSHIDHTEKVENDYVSIINQPGMEIHLMRYDLNGNVLFNNWYEYNGMALELQDIATYDQFIYCLAGQGDYRYMMKMDGGGAVQWTVEIQSATNPQRDLIKVRSISASIHGDGVYLSTEYELNGGSRRDGLMHIEDNGNINYGIHWAYPNNFRLNDHHDQIISTQDHGVLVLKPEISSQGNLVMKFDQSGAISWMRLINNNFGSSTGVFLNACAETNTGEYTLVGSHGGASHTEALAVVLDAQGQTMASDIYHVGGYDFFTGIEVDQQGQIAMTGYHNNGQNFAYIARINNSFSDNCFKSPEVLSNLTQQPYTLINFHHVSMVPVNELGDQIIITLDVPTIHYLCDEQISPPGSPIERLSLIEEKEAQKMSLKLAPNPANKSVFIETVEGAHVKIFDLTGKRVQSFLAVSSMQSIDLTSLHAGIYIVEASINNHVTREKLIIE